MSKRGKIVRFTKRITPYVFKRLLVFVPTLIIISLLSFLISTNAPGDPVSKIVTAMGQDGTASQNSDANQRTKQLVREKLGLDKPIFYFSLGTITDCDTLYRLVDKNHRESAKSLTRDVGDWGLVSSLYKNIKGPIDSLELIYPDSSLSKKELSFKSKLIFNLNGLTDVTSKNELNQKFNLINSLSDSLGKKEGLKGLSKSVENINTKGNSWKKYIPSINWYGMNNQYHLWLLGDFGLKKNIDTLVNIQVKNGVFAFDEFKFVLKEGKWSQFTSGTLVKDTVFKSSYKELDRIEFYDNGRQIEVVKSKGIYNVHIDRGRKGVVRGDFGISFEDGTYVRDKIFNAFSVSFWLILFSIILSYVVSIPVGIISASKRGGKFDRWSSFVLFSLYSLPSFFVATVLLYTFANPDFFVWFPESGIYDPEIFDDNWSLFQKIKHQAPYFILPLVAYTYSSFAFLSRIMRAGMLDVFTKDYIRTARAKGLKESTVVLKHVLKNSLIPIITVFANIFPATVGGSLILESIFNIPGMGKLGYDAILNLDYPMILAVFTISGALTVFGYIVADILYAAVDPRISLTK